MYKVYLFLCFALISGCRLSKSLEGYGKLEDEKIRYSLFYNNRTSTHVPIAIYAMTLNTKTSKHISYLFYLNQNVVTLQKNREHYSLYLEDDTMSLQKKTTKNELIPISSFDRAVFEKVIYFSDSLKLKNFYFLRKAKGFEKAN